MSEIEVLFVDDEVLLTKYFKMLLEDSFNVTTYCTVEEGLQAIREKEFDVVISDFQFDNDQKCRTGLDILDSVQSTHSLRLLCTSYSYAHIKTDKYKIIEKPIDYDLLEMVLLKHGKKVSSERF